ncbi:VOC family protein (plasmid) [Photobacterium sp. GJ3]|uniref:VOC family protein n=1 Tax=Photobacterium sp. GJ3 TaxID=2829502 RepID=UPI001B8B9EEB|nr:VOC family protein [Photobacterium sp. GJ3]QUJ69912.1 VOC family protein [Photobacterium sp. GJ3]
MVTAVRTHLMFEGDAEEAINLYTRLFEFSEIKSIDRYEDGDAAGKIRVAVFTLAGREFMAIDSFVTHQFTFTPAMSVFVDCESIEEFERVYAALSEGGHALMPAENYGFSQRFGWLNDRFGVSWQINLP